MRKVVVALMVTALLSGMSTAMAAEADPSASPAPSVTPVPELTTEPTPSTEPTEPTPTTEPTEPTPTTDPGVVPGPYGIPMEQKIREDSWCQLLLPSGKGDAADARSIMNDNIVDLGQYGYYRLSADPDWKPQSTLDSSGNTHVHGLYWATPLLYTGARRGDVPMVDRFFGLIQDWLGKHKKKKTRTWSVTQPIIAGERLWTLTCAADISNGERFVKATRKEANTQLKAFELDGGTNNTAIHSQGSALAAFCYLGDPTGLTQAADNMNRLADFLILPDGSDREGSPWYAYYTLRLLSKLAPIYQRCGVAYDQIYAATKRLEHFLAVSVDPDFRLVMLGDTHRADLAPKWFAPDSEARWAATEGAEGQPPSALYEAFSGGYVFGRNSWVDIDGHRPTFYSVRAARPYVTAHVHSDLGSVTFNSYGSEFIGDPGPYRYDNSAIRDFVVGRSAHSVIRVTTLAPKKKKKGKKKKSSALGLGAAPPTASESSAVLSAEAGQYDQTCLRDGTYSSAKITRCVYYDSVIDALVVVDSVKALKRIRADQRWMSPASVTVTARTKGARLSGPTASARMAFKGGGKVRTYRPTSKREDGWFTDGYGELVEGTVLQRRETLKKREKVEWISVLAAGTTTPKVSVKDGVVTVTRDGQATQFPLP